MKVLIAAIFISGSIVSAQASSTGPGTMASKLESNLQKEGTTHYDSLAAILRAGNTKPDMDKIVNTVWTGRCYFDRSPNTPMNAGFYLKAKKGSFVGSDGKPVKYYNFFNYNEYRGTEDFFDKMSITDVNEWSPGMVPVETQDFDAIETSNGFSTFEQSGAYLIQEITSFVKVPGKLMNRWVVTGHCYYSQVK